MGNSVVFTLVGKNLLSKTFQEAGDDANALDKKMSGFGQTTSNVLLGVGAAAAVGLGQSISAAMDFDKTMRQVAVQTKESGAGMKELSDLAIKMGEDTVFSASDASAAMLELSKSGLTAAQIKAGALASTMTLAAAGELQMADAATYVGNSMAMFGLEADEANRVVTALAGGANASSASVESLGMALSQVGPGAKLAGASIEETVAVLSAFDAMGIKGSDAGTSLKTMFTRLVPQTEKAAGAMEDLGLKFTTAEGEILPLRDVAEQLRTKLKNLSAEQKTTALSTLFGADAYRAAALMSELGAKGVDRYTKATSDQQAAQDMANVGMEGAKGAWESFKGSIETLTIVLGTKLLPIFTDVTKFLTESALPIVSDIAAMFSKIPEPVGLTIAAIAGLAILGPKLGAFAAAVNTNVIAPLRGAGSAAGGVRSAAGGLLSFFGGPWRAGIAAAGVLLGVLAGKFFEAKSKVDLLTEALKADSGAIRENTRAALAKQIADSGMVQQAAAAGVSLETVTRAILGQNSAWGEIDAKYERMRARLHVLAKSSYVELTQAQRDEEQQLRQNMSKIDQLRHSMEGLSGDLTKAKDDHNNLAEAQRGVKKGTDHLTKATERADEALRDELRSLGLNKDEVVRYTKALQKVPPKVRTAILADLRQAKSALDEFIKKYNGKAGAIRLDADLKSSLAKLNLPGGLMEADGTEDHRAQIAPAGAWRVWAEPETGGEAYIPLSPAKRGRSMQILENVANRFGVDLSHHADGGVVGPVKLRTSVNTGRADRQLSAGIAAAAKAIASIFGGGGSALAFARSQNGKPYVWGGVGPGGYDCSGFMSAIANVIQRRPPHSRLGSTASFPWPGFAPGPGRFMIGSTPNAGNGIGHMAGTLAGVNVESRGGDGVVVGGSARGAGSSLFTQLYHLKGFANGGILSGDAPFDLLDKRGMHARQFDSGGWLMPGTTIAHNGTGKPERVRTAEQERALSDPTAIRKALEGMTIVLDDRGRGRFTAREANLLERG